MTGSAVGARPRFRALYRRIRPLLFLLDAERAHSLTLGALRAVLRYPGMQARVREWLQVPQIPTSLCGLHLPNPVGLAAGLDKDGHYVEALACLGFGWLELGTVTPQPQPGNPRPRLFRVPAAGALVNRMGFNNGGVQALTERLSRLPQRPILGINIGKNRATPPELAARDYTTAFWAVAAHADYVALNISSPNTPGLRDLQAEAALAPLLTAVKQAQSAFAEQRGRYVPLALKLAPDLAPDALERLARQCAETRVDCLIATNTTLARPAGTPADCAGGLSGRPLAPLAAQALSRLHKILKGRIPLIGVGGIDSVESAWERLCLGAQAIQLYTGLIYEGPTLVADIVRGLAARQPTQAPSPPGIGNWSDGSENPAKSGE
ncbi:MAG TPA: quinone-dependent dihydroorotate dehydrogenase [Acidiferrobacteraceae bacterium]|nr:quinone-dependent dihydroorotate dehydrogenase [Acidiferrobacteraceae bacterium]